jgi:hypothetical protein
MKSRLASVLLLVSISVPAQVRQPVSVDQLEQCLAHKEHDSALAEHLATLQLTARLTPPILARLLLAAPGSKSRDELTVLADQSAFLAAPPDASVLPPPPDSDDQRLILARVVDYVATSLHKLPNFYATRTTTQFADWPKGLQVVNRVASRDIPLERVATQRDTVTYRDGKEVVQAPGARQAPTASGRARSVLHAGEGLKTWGVFGPILSVVLVDVAHSTLVWDRWESADDPEPDESDSPVAVFRYAVPVVKSNYHVDYCCVPRGDKLFSFVDRRTAYHGEIAVDPDSGAILRITILADLDQSDPASLASLLEESESVGGEPLLQADLAVEYGPVQIGGAPYICPVRGVALSRLHSMVISGNQADRRYLLGPIRTYLNDSTFTGYHLFRSTSRILPGFEQP